MEKESKLSPVVQPFFPKFHRSDDVMGPVRGDRLATASSSSSSSPPLMRLPNPYLSEQFSRVRRNEAVANPRQRPASAIDGVQQRRGGGGGGGDPPSRHGYSNSRRVRGTADAGAYPSKENDGSIRDPQSSKTPKYSSGDSSSQERRHGKKSSDVSRRGLRDTRSAPLSNSDDRPKSAQTESAVFEVRMTDFPELRIRAGSGSPFVPVQQRACWAPTPECPPSPEIQKPVSTNKTLLTRTGPPARHEPRQRASDAKPASPTVPAGQPAGAQSPADGSGVPVVTSWANVASQPPKAPLPKERTVIGSTSKKDAAREEDSVSEKRKQRRKKKKKGKSAGEDGDEDPPEEAVAQQEPPKFEDEEEFPGLAVAKKCLTGISNTTKLCNEPAGQREGVPPPPQQGDHHQHKDKTTVGKSLPTDATKKAQKAEKATTSGKKSKAPVQLDIGNMLMVLEKKQQSHKAKQETKPVTLSVGGALPAACHVKPAAAGQKKLPWQQDKIAHNPLDSTSPMVKKGKQREVPKAKKPTPLKRVILKEREERKQNRLLEERGLLPGPEEPRPAEQQHAAATEEQCDPPSDTDEINSPPTGPEDEPEGHVESNQTERPGEAEEVEDEEEEEEEGGGGEPTNTLAPPKCLQNTPKIHSRKFRDYCSQVLSRDVDECVTTLLKELVRFQDRLYQKDPMKARMKRRLVMGLREVLKHLKLRKVKCVVISPNCERSQSKGGLDEALHNIINTCREQAVPFVFALSRKALGRCVNKAVPVSLVGIFNYDGAQDFYHKMVELSSEARRAYEVMVENAELAGGQEEEGEEEDPAAGRRDAEETPPTHPPPPDTSCEEPEYIKLWKTVLEKECNHGFLNFEQQLSSMRLASDGAEQSDECEQS